MSPRTVVTDFAALVARAFAFGTRSDGGNRGPITSTAAPKKTGTGAGEARTTRRTCSLVVFDGPTSSFSTLLFLFAAALVSSRLVVLALLRDSCRSCAEYYPHHPYQHAGHAWEHATVWVGGLVAWYRRAARGLVPRRGPLKAGQRKGHSKQCDQWVCFRWPCVVRFPPNLEPPPECGNVEK